MIAHTHVLMYLNTVCREIGMAVASFPQPALPEARADAKESLPSPKGKAAASAKAATAKADAKESQRSPKVKAAASAKADGKNVKAVVKAKD